MLKVLAEPDVSNDGPLVVARGPNLSGMICANDGTGQEQSFKVRACSPPPQLLIPRASCEDTNFSIKRSDYPLLYSVTVSETLCASFLLCCAYRVTLCHE